MKLSELKPDVRNARKRNKRASSTIEHSLKTLGAGRSIVIDKHGAIIAGNGVVENAAKAGITDIEVIQSDGSRIIAVQRVDLDLNTDAKARSHAAAKVLKDRSTFIPHPRISLSHGGVTPGVARHTHELQIRNRTRQRT